jgi:hypothetical protein
MTSAIANTDAKAWRSLRHVTSGPPYREDLTTDAAMLPSQWVTRVMYATVREAALGGVGGIANVRGERFKRHGGEIST